MIEANGYAGVIIAFIPALEFLTDEELGKVVKAFLKSEGSVENPFEGKDEKILAIAYEEFWEAKNAIEIELGI